MHVYIIWKGERSRSRRGLETKAVGGGQTMEMTVKVKAEEAQEKQRCER